MRIDPEQKPEYFAWASKALDAKYSYEDGCRVFTHLHDDGRIAAVVVYSRFHETNCEMSIASDGSRRWITRRFAAMAFAYPFITLKKRRVMGIVKEDNEAALRLDAKLGFQFEGRLRKWFGDKDGILLGMLKEECVWIRGLDK
jgi:RimJ/RimL family protein N-acetyltransferase